MNVVVCPRCNKDVRERSHARGWREDLLKTFNRVPYRCRSCNHRFIDRGMTSNVRKISAGRLSAVLGVAGFAALVWLFSYINSAQRTFAPVEKPALQQPAGEPTS